LKKRSYDNGMNMTEGSYDIVIVGGGFAGASLALMLSATPLRIALIDQKPLAVPLGNSVQFNALDDERAIALAHSSYLIFKTLGLWEELSALVTPIKQVHVSDRGHFGIARLQAENYSVPALGYVIAAHHLANILQKNLQTQTTVDVLAPAQVCQLEKTAEGMRVLIQDAKQQQPLWLNTQLVVAADGGHSAIKNLYQIDSKITDHCQTAIVGNIELARTHHGIAYERFTADGPLAMLPLAENQCGMVWTVATEKVSALMNLDDRKFCQQLQQQLGYRLGKLQRIGKRQAFPLRSIYARQQVFPGLVLVGNAAHNLHPVGGQGLNLSLRDLASLAEVLTHAHKNAQILGCLDVLRCYQQQRQQDQKVIINFSEKVVQLFSNRFSPWVWLRDLGLMGIEILPPIKNHLAKRLMGAQGPLPRLACGLPLDV
jgi:2-octaprenyl-6-methoxyphenol hydroxylase